MGVVGSRFAHVAATTATQTTTLPNTRLMHEKRWHEIKKEVSNVDWWKEKDGKEQWWKEKDGKEQSQHKQDQSKPKSQQQHHVFATQLTNFGFSASMKRSKRLAYIFYPGGRHSDRESAIIQVEIPSNASLRYREGFTSTGGRYIDQWIPQAWAELPSQFQSPFFQKAGKMQLEWNSKSNTLFDTEVIGLQQVRTGTVHFSEGRSQRVITDGALVWDSAEAAIRFGSEERARHARY